MTATGRCRAFLLTGFCEDDVSVKIKDEIASLGGTCLTEFSLGCTHIICCHLTSTEKFLSGLATGKWILTPDYIRDCYKAKKWLPEEKYEWSERRRTKLKKEESNLIKNLESPAKWRKQLANKGVKPFEGWRPVVALNGVRRAMYMRILQRGGAHVIENSSTSPEDLVKQKATHVFTSEARLASLPYSNVTFINVKYIRDHLICTPVPPVSYYYMKNGKGTEEVNYFNKKRDNFVRCRKRHTIKQNATLTDSSEAEHAMISKGCKMPYAKDSFNAILAEARATKIDLSNYHGSDFCLLRCEKDCDSENENPVATMISTNRAETFKICAKTDPAYMIDWLRMNMTNKCYPTPLMTRRLFNNLLLTSEDKHVSEGVFTVFMQLLCMHPPTKPSYYDIYLKAFAEDSISDSPEEWNHDMLHELKWDHLMSLVNVLTSAEDEEHSPEKNLKYFFAFKIVVTTLKINFDHMVNRFIEGVDRSLGETMIAKLLWRFPNSGCMNNQIRDLMLTLVKTVMQENLSSDKNELVSFMQCLLGISAECCRLIHQDSPNLFLKELPHEANNFARQLTAYYTQERSALSCEQWELLLTSIQPCWLRMKVCELILEKYDTSLLAEGVVETNFITMDKIISQYFFVLPPLNQSSPAATGSPSTPHVSADSSTPKPLKPEISASNKPIKSMPEGHLSPSAWKRMVSTINKKNRKGIDVNSQDNCGWTAIHEASRYGHVEIIKELLNFKPVRTTNTCSSNEDQNELAINLKLTSSESCGRLTPLHDAVMSNHVHIAHLLLQYGGLSLLDQKTASGKTAEELAEGNKDMQEMLSTMRLKLGGKQGRKRSLEETEGISNAKRQCFPDSQDFSTSSQASVSDVSPHKCPSDVMYARVISGKTVNEDECPKLLVLLHTAFFTYLKLHQLMDFSDAIRVHGRPKFEEFVVQMNSFESTSQCRLSNQSSALVEQIKSDLISIKRLNVGLLENHVMNIGGCLDDYCHSLLDDIKLVRSVIIENVYP